VLLYASGKNKISFMKLIDNEMYALMLSEGKDAIVDSVGSDYDNEILGTTSVDGMPLFRDVMMKETLITTTAHGVPLMCISPRCGDVVEDLCSTKVIKEDTNCVGVDEKFGDYFPDNIDVNLSETSTWDPFGGVVATEGFVYIGKLAFLCFGPTLKYFTGTLANGGLSKRSVEEKKSGSRNMQCKVNAEQDNLDGEVGGSERGLAIQSKMQCAFMAQNKDDADQSHQDMRMVILSKQIESTEHLVELKSKTLERMSLGGPEAQIFMSINLLMENLEKLNEQLDAMMTEKRSTNPIAGNVLVIASKAMVLPKRDKDHNDNIQCLILLL
jgi:hypothetical protein